VSAIEARGPLLRGSPSNEARGRSLRGVSAIEARGPSLRGSNEACGPSLRGSPSNEARGRWSLGLRWSKTVSANEARRRSLPLSRRSEIATAGLPRPLRVDTDLAAGRVGAARLSPREPALDRRERPASDVRAAALLRALRLRVPGIVVANGDAVCSSCSAAIMSTSAHVAGASRPVRA
jgi:hypothetical protein